LLIIALYLLRQTNGQSKATRRQNSVMNIDNYKSEVIERYERGETCQDLADAYGCGAATVWKRLKRWGVNPQRKYKKIVIQEPEKTEIITRYLDGESARSLGIRYPYSRDTIVSRLQDWGIETRTNRYDINHDAFSVTNPEVMYWAGYLMGDGSVYKEYNNWAINISSKDIGIVKKFRTFIGGEGMPIYKAKTGVCSLAVTSSQIKQDLENFGVIPRKSKKAKIPNNGTLTNRDFWRGLIDSDGWLGFSSNRYTPLVGFGSGSKKLVSQYVEFLKYYNLYSGNKIYSRKDVKSGFWSFVTRCELASELAGFLYTDSTIYLQRKYEIAQKVMNYYQDAQ
jgi:hypothetical protein